MGVSVEGGKGRGKSMGVELNLVPFIDFLSCLIAFLMISAVWTQISALETEQNISDAPPSEPVDPPPPPPLTVKVSAEGHYLARNPPFTAVPKVGEDYDYAKLRELITADHELLPAETMVVINTDDGVPYEEMIKVLDMTRELGYPQTLLAGGPPAAVEVAPPGGVPAPPPG